jgi:hypothetical protein
MRFLSTIKIFTTALLLLFFSHTKAQQKPMKQFIKLSRPEKLWVMTHPFIAKKVFHISNEASSRAGQIWKDYNIKNSPAGGQSDAFRHGYWMALLSQQIMPRKALKLGKIHEKGNYLDYKKSRKEDGIKASKTLCEMDLWNNHEGIKIGIEHKNAPKEIIEKRIVEAILDGKMKVVKMDPQNRFVNCEGQLISLPELQKWDPPKCLIWSNEE